MSETLQTRTRSAKSWTKSAVNVVGALLGGALLYWVLAQVEFQRVWEALVGLHLSLLVLVLPIVVTDLVVRAVRWQTLFPKHQKPSVGGSFCAMMVGYLVNNVLPARTGDLVRVFVLGNRESIPKSLVLATVLLERIADLFTLIAMLVLATLLVEVPEWMRGGGILLGVSALAAGTALVGVWLSAERAIAFVGAERWFLPRWFSVRLGRVLREFTLGLGTFGRWDTIVPFALWTGSLWAMEIAIVWLLARAFAIDLSILESWVLMLFGALSSLVPALPAQLGAFEFAGTTGLASLGHAGGSAVAFVLAWHMTLLLMSSSIGAVCLALEGQALVPIGRLAWTGRREPEMEQSVSSTSSSISVSESCEG